MRTQLLAYLTANLTGSIKPSQELPFEQSGNSLYLKNLRRVYLNEPSTEQDQLIGTFDDDINQQITTVQAFLAVDAKNRNADLDSALTTMSQALKQADITDSFRKEFDYTTTLDDDKIIYEFEYRYYQII
jgi:hypothetical protein